MLKRNAPFWANRCPIIRVDLVLGALPSADMLLIPRAESQSLPAQLAESWTVVCLWVTSNHTERLDP